MVIVLNRIEWVIKLKKSLYGLNKSSETWFGIQNIGLERRVYHKSLVDPCVFYRKAQLF